MSGELAPKEAVSALSPHSLTLRCPRILSFAVFTCRHLATCSADTTVKIWSTSRYEFALEKTLVGHQRWVWDAAFSADSAYLVTGKSSIKLEHHLCLLDRFTRKSHRTPQTYSSFPAASSFRNVLQIHSIIRSCCSPMGTLVRRDCQAVQRAQ